MTQKVQIILHNWILQRMSKRPFQQEKKLFKYNQLHPPRNKNTFIKNVGLIKCKLKNGEHSYGTAYLIAKNLIFTCAHNVVHDNEILEVNSMRFIRCQDGKRKKSDVFKVNEIKIPKEYLDNYSNQLERFKYDYALLFVHNELQEKRDLDWDYMCFRPIEKMNMQDIQDKAVFIQIYGYPDQFQSSGKGQFFIYGSGTKDIQIDAKSGKRYLKYKLSTYKGSSGSSIVYYSPEAEDFQIIGIHTHSGAQGENYNRGLLITQVMLDEMSRWAEELTGDPVKVQNSIIKLKFNEQVEDDESDHEVIEKSLILQSKVKVEDEKIQNQRRNLINQRKSEPQNQKNVLKKEEQARIYQKQEKKFMKEYREINQKVINTSPLKKIPLLSGKIETKEELDKYLMNQSKTCEKVEDFRLYNRQFNQNLLKYMSSVKYIFLVEQYLQTIITVLRQKVFLIIARPSHLAQVLDEITAVNNEIKVIQSIFHVKTLSTLALNNNKIKEVPSQIKNLTALQILDLSHNFIQHLPKQLFTSASLKDIKLENNHLTEVSEWITEVPMQKIYNFNNNQIAEINIKMPLPQSLWLSQMTLKVYGNPPLLERAKKQPEFLDYINVLSKGMKLKNQLIRQQQDIAKEPV